MIRYLQANCKFFLVEGERVENSPCISVIVPVYNVERYVKLCIDSILGQTFQNFEVIIVDDASPDNSYEICQNLYGTNDKVRILRHSENQGIGPARNTGMANARGKYIYFVDSDDVIVTKALEILYKTAENTGADVVHLSEWYETNQDDDKRLRIQNLKIVAEQYKQTGFLKYDIPWRLENCWERGSMWSMAWLCMYRREFLEANDIKYFSVISEDELFALTIYCRAEKFYVLRETLYVYRKRQSSIMRNYSADRLSNGVKSMLIGVKHLQNLFSTIPELANNPILQNNLIIQMVARFSINHIAPFYDGKISAEELYEIIFNGLQPTFKENISIAKAIFDLMNIYRTQIDSFRQSFDNLVQQNQLLQYQLTNYEIFMREKDAMLNLLNQIKNADKKFLFMLTPTHGNLGDQAIVLAEYYIMSRCFPDYQIIEIPYDYLVGERGKIFSGLGYAKYIHSDDYIILHGGGNLGNLWLHEETARRAVIEKFPNNRIVIFPQSVHFSDDAEGQRQIAESSRVYNSHPDLHLMLRDENSFDVANKIFPNVQTYLVPDIVTALFGTFDNVNISRRGVLFVLRNDKEKIRNDNLINQLQRWLASQNVPFNVIDTVINDKVSKQTRAQKVSEVVLKIRQSKVVITDRFHGVIFSFITRTPVLAFKSYDTKISSGIKWFKDFPSVFYAENSALPEMINFIVKAYNGDLEANLNTPPRIFSNTKQLCKKLFQK